MVWKDQPVVYQKTISILLRGHFAVYVENASALGNLLAWNIVDAYVFRVVKYIL